MLVSLIGIFIVKRRRYLNNEYDLKPKGGIINATGASDSASIITESSSSSASSSGSQKTNGDKSEWKTFWPFKKKQSTTSTSSEKPFAKQDYEVNRRNMFLNLTILNKFL